jgi:hypothetical protein
MMLSAVPIRGQDCTSQITKVQYDVWDLKSAVGLLLRQNLESAINGRVKETFDLVASPDGTAFCATTTPAVSLPLGQVNGVPDGVSNQARCALYCQNYDGCISFNYFRNALLDGTQCQLYTKAPTACKSDANCQHYQASGMKEGSCRSTADFTYMPASETYYKPIFESLTWAEAADRCKQINPFAHLAVFNSMAEFNEVTSYLKTFPASQAWACSTNVGFGSDWSGWWTAKRKLTDDAASYAACKAAQSAWVLDSKKTQILPEQSWESSMWLSAAFPDCTQYWKKSLNWEMCMAIPVNHLYLLNDMMCDYKQCALCKLD